MNQVFNQSKNKRIIVISFLSLSPLQNSTSNVFELFASFKAANALNHWNLSLIQAVQNCVLVGHIDPHVIMLGGSQNYLEIIKLAWMKQILKSPLGFTIQYLGELCNFLVSKTPQCSTVELEEAICKCVCELVNVGLPSNLKNIIRYVTKFLPATGDNSVYESENFLSTEMIKSIIDSLQQKGLIYNTGHGFNVMTADKLRVAKWLGELPDTRRTSVSSSDTEERQRGNTGLSGAIHGCQRSANRFPGAANREQWSENTDDCLSCYDLRGNKYYSNQPITSAAAQTDSGRIIGPDTANCPQVNDHYRANCLGTDSGNRDARLISNDASLHKPRMLCTNISKKDLPKRQSCVKYESNFISRIICGMKKLKIHWPAKNGVVRSSNIGVPDAYNKNYFASYLDDTTALNSRLSQSMYGFNQCADIQASAESQSPPNDASFIPYGVNYSSTEIERSFMLLEEQRCCSELMLTPANLYSMVPPKPRAEQQEQAAAVMAAINQRYLSPFTTCDSGFNSVHGAQMPEGDTSQSKTSSPPDLVSSKKLSYQSGGASQYGGPCAWHISSLNDSVYQTTRAYQSPVLAPVLESSRYPK